jgi:hypothetical protein
MLVAGDKGWIMDENEKENLRGTIDLGRAALSTVTLINGGAAVAVLAFIGSIWGKTGSTALLHQMADAASAFTVGVFLGGIATATAYLAQGYAWKQRDTETMWTGLFTFLLVIMAYIAFAYGIAQAICAIKVIPH